MINKFPRTRVELLLVAGFGVFLASAAFTQTLPPGSSGGSDTPTGLAGSLGGSLATGGGS